MKFIIVILLILGFIYPTGVSAERRTIEADGSYQVGDGIEENHSVAKQRAEDTAKRRASEEAALYLESTSEEKLGYLTKDEIRVVTAQILEVKDVKITPQVIGDTVRYNCHVIVVVDTDNINQRLLNNSAELRTAAQRLATAENENVRLRKELNDLKLQLNNTKKANEQNKIKLKMKENDAQYQSLQAYMKGEEFASAGKLTEAITCYENAIALNQNNIDAYGRLAYLYSLEKKIDRNKLREFVDTGIHLAKKLYMKKEIDFLVNCSIYYKDGYIVGTQSPLYDLYNVKNQLETPDVFYVDTDEMKDPNTGKIIHNMIRVTLKTDW